MRLLDDFRQTFQLAVPLMIGQISQMLLGVADTLMVGHLGVTQLAALTFANSLFYIPLIFGMGILTSVSVTTSHARGAQNPQAARSSCRHGIYLGTVIGILLFLVALALSHQLNWFGQPEDVEKQTGTFYRILMASLIPALASIALKNHADALNRPWPAFWIFFGGVLLNVLLNWVMIFGKLGCPAFGFNGAAWATLISRTAILGAMLLWLVQSRTLHQWIPQRWLRKPHIPSIRKLLSLGVPASLQMLTEVTAFSVAGLLMGHISADAMAAHQITISLTGTAFMIPLGYSMALTVRVGEVFGARDYDRLKSVAISGWLALILIATLNASCFLTLGHSMASWFTETGHLIELTAALLGICGIFQLFDALQVGSASMLRGLHDTRIPAFIGFASYWIVGIPFGAWLAFSMNLGARGVWWGLAVGLATACITLGSRMILALRKHAN